MQLGKVPSAEALMVLGLGSFPGEQGEQQQRAAALDTASALTSIVPLLTAFSGTSEPQEKAESKPSRYLVAKGLPTLPTKLVDKVWNLEFVDMEEFLPAPRALRIREQGKPAPSLQDSLVGAFSQFQALQQHRKHNIGC